MDALAVGLADHRTHGNPVERLNTAFHFHGKYLVAADDQHVLAAVADAHIALFIHHANITGEHPGFAIDLAQGFFTGLRHGQIAFHHLRAADDDLAGFAFGQWTFSALRINDAPLGAGYGNAHRAGLEARCRVDGLYRAGFGHAVDFAELVRTNNGGQLGDFFFGERCGARHSDTQRGKIQLFEAIVLT